ncbi:HEXXH motif-containing putative peptide modification protein [Epilithonimonas sp. JDS]|uniref:aKG-HExxH-type peptide beta-hydroxylase n=1 Tax=Epilithonimonas sp. JDS TaxID=2902797 RepID=UPI001E635A3E|nr:HEXXH motif-containing putative peptide modification protein [Epilithonimonas sp. JDS]MCD9855775.1 HEXXH motif-containing putative peptide modification protein [Epilithonimonas sp. JDS]
MMEDKIIQFLNNPFPIWETDLTTDLVNEELLQLAKSGLNSDNYSTSGGYFKNVFELKKIPIIVSRQSATESTYLEYPDFSAFNFFYEEHGLEPEEYTVITSDPIDRLKTALDIFNLIPDVSRCISLLVRRIQVLKSVDEEIDISYSHPEIPFSIFVSLCSCSSIISNLRVAESILHEAMHLKLTLIEKHINLIKPETTETFYSPWRDEQRPVRGVLHGLFVFSAIKLFYENLLQMPFDPKTINFLKYKIEDINTEFETIVQFTKNKGLTEAGKIFSTNLLQN